MHGYGGLAARGLLCCGRSSCWLAHTAYAFAKLVDAVLLDLAYLLLAVMCMHVSKVCMYAAAHNVLVSGDTWQEDSV